LVTPVAVVTGSASGIGLATARLAADRRYRVVGIDVAADRPDEHVVERSGGAAFHADVARADEVCVRFRAGDDAAARAALGRLRRRDDARR
jgi:NAD(P)-dependent dehydrogenase (short-subunit alcohol dehydrogenase family)